MYMLPFHMENLKTEALAIFLNPFTVCLPCKRKFIVVRLFMKKHSEVIRLNGLAHLCPLPYGPYNDT